MEEGPQKEAEISALEQSEAFLLEEAEELGIEVSLEDVPEEEPEDEYVSDFVITVLHKDKDHGKNKVVEVTGKEIYDACFTIFSALEAISSLCLFQTL